MVLDHALLRRTMPVAALVAYVATALWMRYELDYAIGDAVSRSASARATIFSRAPSLTAVGLVWMPLPTLLQLPFSLVLEPFGRAELAGPFLTASAGALTVRSMLGTFERLGVDPWLAAGLGAAYAFNPVIAFHAANGMSEALFFLCLVSLAGAYLDWSESEAMRPLIRISVCLAAAMGIRYETLAMALVIGVLVGLRRPTWTQRGLTTMVVGLPAAYVFLLWLGFNRVIMGSAFFWNTALASMATPPDGAPWLPSDNSLSQGVRYAFERTMALAPGMVALAPCLLLSRRRTPLLQGMGLVALGGLFPAFIVYLFLQNQTWGNLRYFAPSIPVLVLAVGWLVARDDELGLALRRQRSVQGLLVALVALGMYSGTVAMADPERAAVESEWKVFQPALGRQLGLDIPSELGRWRITTAQIDAALDAAPEDARILTNMGSAFPVFAMTDHPGQFILDHDPDHEPSVAAGYRSVDFVYVAPGVSAPTLESAMGDTPERTWRITELGVGTLYQRLPEPAS